jgi:MFS transporter, DHA1 family, multidrug resistance protein
MTSQQKRQILNALFVVIFAVTLGFAVVNPFFPIYMKNITGQGIGIALVFSGFFLAKMIFTPLFCRWSDFINRRTFILCGLALHTGIAFLFLLLPENILFILFLRFLQGAATAMVRPIAQAFVGDISPEHREGSTMGAFDISFYAALGIGPLVGGIIGDFLGCRAMFLMLFILCLAALFIAAIAVESLEPPQSEPRPSVRYEMHIFRNQTLQGLFFFIFTRSFGIVVLPIFLPLLLRTRFQASYIEIGICAAAGSVTTAVLLGWMGKLSDRWDRKTMITAGGFLSGILILVFPMAHDSRQIIALTVAQAFFSTLSLPASFAMLIDQGRKYGLGQAMGIAHTLMNIGFFTGPLAAGLLMDELGLGIVFAAAGLAGIAGSLFFAVHCPAHCEARDDGWERFRA